MKIRNLTAIAGVTVALAAGGLLLLTNGTTAEVPVHTVKAVATVVPQSPSASPSTSVSPSAPASPSPVNVPIPPVTQAARKPAPLAAPQVVNLYPVTAIGSQATIDQGKLVTWMTSPTCLLAGHDSEGWAFLSSVPIGTVVDVHTGPCAGTYKIVNHSWQSVKGGPVPAWMSQYPLVLQSCTGSTGMGFSDAVRI